MNQCFAQVLDSVVIKLEGGTDFDLTVLDLPDEEEAESSKEVKDRGKQKDGDKEEKSRKRKRDKPAEVRFSIKRFSWSSLRPFLSKILYG